MPVTKTVPRVVYWLVIAILLAIGGVSVALGGLLLAQYQERYWVPAARWWALSVYTCFLFGYVIRESRRDWHHPLLWLGVLTLLACHTFGYTWLLRTVTEWRNIWFLPLIVAEYSLVVFSLTLILGKRRQRQ
jgi:hypothetical protein